jgi:hypothetical protein
MVPLDREYEPASVGSVCAVFPRSECLDTVP